MKKFVFGLMTLVAVALTSCLPDSPGYTYTGTFARLVTIDHATVPPRFYCDYTNEVFEFSNITTDADLGKYDLDDVQRALILVNIDVVNYDVDYTLVSGDAITVYSVYNKDFVMDDSFGPVYGFSNLELERAWSYPYAWVSRGYLSIIPQIKADKAGEHLLVPEGVSNDTLSFSLHSRYTLGGELRGDYTCFDLRTLADTATAEPGTKTVMTAMLDRLNHSSDSVMVVVVADYLNVYPDTIIKTVVPTNYFYLRID
ncbi:MAG: hypothetical protein IK011_04155 [Bacteroidaceae bacterium]|nr:hypothetical protein [Bacteroidaceae bacterium]MBR4779063.1 hypothetical protein [Bacteroidaceae bacterium]